MTVSFVSHHSAFVIVVIIDLITFGKVFRNF